MKDYRNIALQTISRLALLFVTLTLFSSPALATAGEPEAGSTLAMLVKMGSVLVAVLLAGVVAKKIKLSRIAVRKTDAPSTEKTGPEKKS